MIPMIPVPFRHAVPVPGTEEFAMGIGISVPKMLRLRTESESESESESETESESESETDTENWAIFSTPENRCRYRWNCCGRVPQEKLQAAVILGDSTSKPSFLCGEISGRSTKMEVSVSS